MWRTVYELDQSAFPFIYFLINISMGLIDNRVQSYIIPYIRVTKMYGESGHKYFSKKQKKKK